MNRTPLRLADFAALHQQKALPHGAVAVTFDDGYACNGLIAVPLLREFGIPATFFLPANLIAEQRLFWWDELEEIVLEHDGRSLEVGDDEVVLGARSPLDRKWNPWTEAQTPRQQAFSIIQSRLSRMKPADTQAAMLNLRRQSERSGVSAPHKRPLTFGEIETAAQSGIELGSHTLNHPWLPNLKASEQRHEICSSVEACGALGANAPMTFAYPYGMYDPTSEQFAKEAGFVCACTTGDLAVSARSRTFALPRLHVGNWDAALLERTLQRLRAE